MSFGALEKYIFFHHFTRGIHDGGPMIAAAQQGTSLGGIPVQGMPHPCILGFLCQTLEPSSPWKQPRRR